MIYTKDVLETRLSIFLHQSILSDNTKRLYKQYVGNFIAWCYESGHDPEKADQGLVNTWFGENLQWSSSTRRNALVSIRNFYLYEFGPDHPIQKARTSYEDPGPQRCLSEDELLTLISAIDTNRVKGIRDIAVITLLADTGLRVEELCSIELKRLNMQKKELTVKIKGVDWGRAVFFDYTHSCLENWLFVRPQVARPDNRYLFASVGGHTPGRRLKPDGIRKMFQDLCNKTGIEHTTPHAMRRTFATQAILNGAPTRVVQEAGRWKTLRQVERYTRTLQQDAIRPYSVINNLMGLREE